MCETEEKVEEIEEEKQNMEKRRKGREKIEERERKRGGKGGKQGKDGREGSRWLPPRTLEGLQEEFVVCVHFLAGLFPSERLLLLLRHLGSPAPLITPSGPRLRCLSDVIYRAPPPP